MANLAAGRIVVVLHDFSGGGSERVAITLANDWAAAGRQVTLVCGTEAGPLRGQVALGVVVRPVAPPVVRGPASRARLGRAVAAILPAIGPDIVVGPGNFHVDVLAAMLADYGRTAPPVVCKLSNSLRRPGRTAIEQALFAMALTAATRRFAGLVALSPRLAAEAQGVLGRPVGWLANPVVDDDWSSPVSRPRTGVVVCAGRLSRQKDFTLALRAFAAAGDGGRLVVLGDGEERTALAALADRLGVAARVAFAGHVGAIAPYLAQADALLCSSRYEGYPSVLVEALAAGVPVVTTPCSPAISEIVAHPSFGEIVAAEPAALAAALVRVAAGPRPDGRALARLLVPHRRRRASAAWLDVLDGVVARQPADRRFMQESANRGGFPFRSPARRTRSA